MNNKEKNIASLLNFLESDRPIKDLSRKELSYLYKISRDEIDYFDFSSLFKNELLKRLENEKELKEIE